MNINIMNIKFLSLLVIIIFPLIAKQSISLDCSKFSNSFKAEKKIFRHGGSLSDPKVRIHHKVCGLAFTGSDRSAVMSGFGGCKFIGLVRFCARPALPGKHGNNSDRVRICGYEDTMFPGDFNDFSAHRMLYQKNSTIDSITDEDGLLKNMGITRDKMFFYPSSSIVKELIEWNNDLWRGLPLIDKKMPINNVVVDEIGCVDLEMGPYPAPFCDNFDPPPLQVRADDICAQDEVPTIDNICYKSKEGASSFERPMVRIGLDDIQALCAGNTAENCVILKENNQQVNNISQKIDFIGSCDKGENVCLVAPSYYSFLPTNLRALYVSGNAVNLQNKDAIPLVENYNSNLNFYGANLGDYKDIIFNYNETTGNYDTQEIQLKELGVNSVKTRKFHVTLDTDSSDICVFEEGEDITQKLNCILRPQAPIPYVTKCGEPLCKKDDINCISPIIPAINCGAELPSNRKLVIGFGNPIRYAIASEQGETVKLYGINFSLKRFNKETQSPDDKGDLLCLLNYEPNEYVLVRQIDYTDTELNETIRVPSYNPKDRLFPLYEESNPMIVEDKYVPGAIIDYPGRQAPGNTEMPNITVNIATESIRPKTNIEQGLCIKLN